MNVAVRGASGFIGSHLAKKIIEENNYKKLILITRNKNNKKVNKFVRNKGKVEIAQCDNLDSFQLKKIIKGCDLVYDLSGLAYQTFSKDALSKQVIENSMSALVLGSVLDRRQRLVWVSTSAVYTYLNSPSSFYTQSYAFSKYLGEEFLKKFSKGRLKILRISDVYGPGQDVSEKMINPQIPARRIQRFISAYRLISQKRTGWIPKKGKSLHGFYKKGNKIFHEISNDFVYPTYIDDVVVFLINAGKTKDKKVAYELIGERLSNLEIVRIIQNLLKTKIEIKVRNTDIKPLKKKESHFRKLGINPNSLTTFSEGLAKWLFQK